MDRHKASWILEFVLRQPIDDWLAKEILLRLPTPPLLDPHLKKTLLLRRLSSDLSAAPLSHHTLHSLELLEELDRCLGAAQPNEALKAAYCAVAAELTVAPLRRTGLPSEADAEFLEAADRIWSRRVPDLERSEARGLVGERLSGWRREVEDAVAGGVAARVRLLRRDTRREAEAALGEYVRVALEEMGPPLLLLMAGAEGVAGRPGGGADPRDGSRVSAKPSGVGAEQSVSTTVAMADSVRLASATGTGAIIPSQEERPKGSEMAGQTHSHDKDRIFEPHLFPLPEANEAQEALDSITVDLRKVVENPIPDAVVKAAELENRIAEAPTKPNDLGHDQNQAVMGVARPSIEKHAQATATEKTVFEGQQSGEHAEMMQNRMTEPLANPNDSGHYQNQADMDVTRPSIGKDAQVTSIKGVANEDQQGGECGKAPHISLMERNPTARTCQWDEDPDEFLSEKSADSSKRPYLPTPRTRRVSPLKLYKDAKFVRRRKNKRWTPQEEDALRDAVKKHGKGNWKFILQCYAGTFEDRTEVDLKDKWRNMTR